MLVDGRGVLQKGRFISGGGCWGAMVAGCYTAHRVDAQAPRALIRDYLCFSKIEINYTAHNEHREAASSIEVLRARTDRLDCPRVVAFFLFWA